MIIENISCTQFAGLRERSVSLGEGINLLYGKNESGKSSLVNLLSRTLFQSAKLDRRRDKGFYEQYFPAALKGGSVGDYADGKVSIQSEKGRYIISKEWGAEPRCMLSTPEGNIRNQESADAVLRELLGYGEGVYNEMLLSSQHNTGETLKALLNLAEKSAGKQELTEALTRAFSQSDGISGEAIERAINGKIEEICGKHWDLQRNAPVRKAGGRWEKGVGEILKAWYALEDAREELQQLERLDREADRAAEAYKAKDAAARQAEEKYRDFHAVSAALTLQSERRRALARLEAEQNKLRDTLDQWPELSAAAKRAKTLEEEIKDRDCRDKYESARAIKETLEQLKAQYEGKPCPTEEEIRALKAAQRKIVALENRLCGMNLTAAVKLLGDYGMEITTLRTGERVEIIEGSAAITEAVRLSVPGVMELQLSPANVAVGEIRRQLEPERMAAEEILSSYGAEDAEALERLAADYREAESRAAAMKQRLETLLAGQSYEELSAAAEPCTARSREDIQRDISICCGSTDIVRFIAEKETYIAGFIRDYGSLAGLKAMFFDIAEELQRAREAVQAAEDIPGQYAHIADPEAHLKRLEAELKAQQADREEAFKAKAGAMSRADSFRENLDGEPLESVQRCERIFNEKQALLGHWLHIGEVFRRQQAAVEENPMQDLADSFSRYLSIIAQGGVSTELSGRGLDIQIYSRSGLMDYDKLSEGTKETVSLAFRLAVLDKLFPQGGGVVVLDDPLADMDSERAQRACLLIKDCALRHQVIFLTCHEEYAAMLGVESINI